VAPKEITGVDGKVTQLVCHIMALGEPDGSGRRSPVETGETMVLDVDMVIKAAGRMPYEGLVAGNNFQHDYGKIQIDDEGVTNIAGIFAGGDCVNGGKEVVDAVQAGKDGATGILN
jgi:dihydropyrimidine dehydrogenase (NAD+) subunit PreT